MKTRAGCTLPPFETLRFAPFLRVRWVCSDQAETFTNSEERVVAFTCAFSERLEG